MDIQVNPDAEERYLKEYGELYREARDRVKAALNKPIASLFDLPKSPKSKIKTEVLFIERCLDLLKPGGTSRHRATGRHLQQPLPRLCA